MTNKHMLQGFSLDELEVLYKTTEAREVPKRLYSGQVLHRVEADFAHTRTASSIMWPFVNLRFGVDFRSNRWFFVNPSFQLGHFRTELGQSRWRDTETIRLHYDVSRLPLRAGLYDEIKPLDDKHCLGLGGINRDKGLGELFFFLLEAVE